MEDSAGERGRRDGWTVRGKMVRERRKHKGEEKGLGGTKRGRRRYEEGDRCERGLGVIREEEGEATHRWGNKGEGGTRQEEIHWKGLVVCGDNTRFLTGRKSELREAPRPDAPFPLVKSSRLASRL